MEFNSGRPEFNRGSPVLYLSISEGLSEVATACGCWSVSLKTLSMTESSVLVVSSPQKAHQSLTTIPADSTSLPLFTVPAWGARWRGEGGGGRLVKYTLLVWAYVRMKNDSYHEWNLKQRGELVLVFNLCLRMYLQHQPNTQLHTLTDTSTSLHRQLLPHLLHSPALLGWRSSSTSPPVRCQPPSA